MFATGLTAAQILANVQARLLALRQALEAVTDLQEWSSGVTGADMETATGLSASDAATLQSAIADAAALADIYDSGLPPGSYPQPASAYVYAATQRQVIGPQ